MSLKDFRIVSLTEFRHNTGPLMEWVETTGNRIWLKRYGRLVGAVVPMDQCEKLEAFEGRTLADRRRRLEEEYGAWKRMKALGHLDKDQPFDWEREGFTTKYATFEAEEKRKAEDRARERQRMRDLQALAELDELLGPEDDPLPEEEVERRLALERLRHQK
ncbi:hypothetical protein [Primorskyibacter sp. S187A]|uniref:hypothetical protein n=1 Tax=Primorskyibacter sp. S187A TaxID=3415130 RepID=UPI003C7BF46B